MNPIPADLQVILNRIEDLESSYRLGEVAYLKAHYDELFRYAEKLEQFVDYVAHFDTDEPLALLGLRVSASDLLKALK